MTDGELSHLATEAALSPGKGIRYQIGRVGLSVPCEVPVVPGTPEVDAPLELRTETCSVNAWWWVGAIPTCDYHLRIALELMGDDYDEVVKDLRAKGYPEVEIPNETERKPWSKQYRYPQSKQGGSNNGS